MFGSLTERPLLVSEYGIDAYDVDAIDDQRVAADPRDIGAENEGMQAEWLISLVEDLERHSSACHVGCAPQEGLHLVWLCLLWLYSLLALTLVVLTVTGGPHRIGRLDHGVAGRVVEGARHRGG